MQYSAKRDLELFGYGGEEALSKELQQVHDWDIFDPEDLRSLTRAQCRAALEYLMFLEKKRSGKTKA